MDATLRRQFRHIVSLASLAYIFFAIHTIQYSLLDHDMDEVIVEVEEVEEQSDSDEDDSESGR